LERIKIGVLMFRDLAVSHNYQPQIASDGLIHKKILEFSEDLLQLPCEQSL